jgi:Ca-activated chloride channel family protein
MIMNKKTKRFTIIMFGLLSIAFIGCGGGGGNDVASSTPTPALEVLPGDFQFATVTDGNTVEPLTVTLRNGGNADLVVSGITLSDTNNYTLDFINGTGSCGSATPTILSGGSCTVTVGFIPQSFDTFLADLTIISNDANTPYIMALQGTKEDITAVNVNINQIEACPRANAKVYVSVTDQGGFPVRGLLQADFSLVEDGGASVPPTTFGFVNNSVSLSVALLMDYSGSITMEPENVTDMENAAISFVNQLGVNDEAEIIKYATTIQVTRSFTSDKARLISAIESTPNIGSTTALFDAITRGVTDISTRTKIRRAIIVITDGDDNDGTGNPLSSSTLASIIADAKANGVPVFTVGLGNADATVLQQLADDTGGTYSDSATSDNLGTIYQQLADLLFTDQYILTYNSGIAEDGVSTGELTVSATYDLGVSGTDTKTVLACP